MKNKVIIASFLIVVFSAILCLSANTASLVNPAHLNYLYEEAEVNGREAAFIYIYAEYPDYTRIGAPGEGIACVDDVARAAIFYMRHYETTGQPEYLQRSKKLLNFILALQNENGFFHNFIDKDHRIVTDTFNSRAKADWWTWRALWALAEALPVFQKTDGQFYQQIADALLQVITAADSVLANHPRTKTLHGFDLPTWLPYETATDQASVFLLGLMAYQRHAPSVAAIEMIRKLADGILKMQVGDSLSFPHGVFLSWENTWHAWGNSQADALLQTAPYLKGPAQAALTEVTFFYPWLQKQNYLREMRFERAGDSIAVAHLEQFSQIAYDIRPMVMASLEAYRMTKNETYAVQAGELAAWLFGKNITGKSLYDPETGRCFDGINNASEINYNSGAESTIEALLILQAVEDNPVALKTLREALSPLRRGAGGKEGSDTSQH